MYVTLMAVTAVYAGEGAGYLVTSLGVSVRSGVGKQKQRETHRKLNIHLNKGASSFHVV